MSVFLERQHLFLRNPRGGVEGVAEMAAAGFTAIFCNIKDHYPEEWSVIRERAKALDVVCGPWARTERDGEFIPEMLTHLIETSQAWDDSPYIVNSEAELKASGSDLTDYIQRICGGDDWALSMEPWPFANVDWTPIKAPVLPQCFGPDWGSKTDEVRAEWRRVGIPCVVPTYASYSSWQPDLYDRRAPYGVYTADDCGNNYAPWAKTGDLAPCVVPVPPQPEPPEDGMEKIGSEHGVKAWYNRMKVLDPDYCTPEFNPDDYDAIPPKQLKAHSKLCRSLMILVKDHDEALSG